MTGSPRTGVARESDCHEHVKRSSDFRKQFGIETTSRSGFLVELTVVETCAANHCDSHQRWMAVRFGLAAETHTCIKHPCHLLYVRRYWDRVACREIVLYSPAGSRIFWLR